jgi:hypothetical protein
VESGAKPNRVSPVKAINNAIPIDDRVGNALARATIDEVDQFLGHRSVAFTLTVYGHLPDSGLDELAAPFDNSKNQRTRVASVSFEEPTADAGCQT